jgi:gamma-glutamylcyclotransferase (GGCT)/AIG2-like uncharacterized protein YtfP
MVEFFTYGTLMSKHFANNILSSMKAEFLRLARTKPVFRLFDFYNRFPGILHGGSLKIHGEVYNIPENGLNILDEYEGVPIGYLREEIELDDGCKVIAYILNPKFLALKPAHFVQELNDGDWSVYHKAQTQHESK